MRWATAVLYGVACSTAGSPSLPAGDGGAPTEAKAAELPHPSAPPFGKEVASLRLKRSIVVRAEPAEDAKPLGTVSADTRVAYRTAAEGPGCDRWIEILPRGWVCDRYLEPSSKRPVALELPRLKASELVPGQYGRVSAGGARTYASVGDVLAGRAARTLAGAVTVRKVDEVQVGRRLLWRTSSGELVEASRIRPHEPSTFAGVQLEASSGPNLPFAWAQLPGGRSGEVALRSAPDPHAPILRRVPRRTVLPVREPSKDGTFLRVGEGEWAAAGDLRLARASDPPPFTADDEKWIDVDLDQQVLVAYEGARPVFATLVSSGNRKWPTTEGVYRIWIKFAETDMSGQMGDEQPYSVATVPWTAYFAKDLALHAAYWHDRFGEPRSHGCVNLAPLDARWLYFWSSPQVPQGWSMAHGLFENPGSIVRIRSRAVPQPEFMGYARRVQEARLTDRLTTPATP